jgi:mono/diheme cytochrome c family protein
MIRSTDFHRGEFMSASRSRGAMTPPRRALKILLFIGGVTAFAVSASAGTRESQAERGKYLVQISGCNDCHTPGYFLGKADMSRYLAGSDVAFPLPGGGLVIARNLTPDRETGIGSWTIEQIATAIRSGVRPDGRVLAPIMPYAAYAHLTPSDAAAVAAFLKTLTPVRNKIPGPLAANQAATTFRWQLVPPPAASSGSR